MKHLSTGVAAAAVLLMGSAAIADNNPLTSSLQSSFYVNVPFGDACRNQHAPSVGLAFTQGTSLVEEAQTPQAERFITPYQSYFGDDKALAEIKYDLGTQQLTNLNVGGVNTLRFETRFNAEGELETAPAGLNPVLFITGVAGVFFLVDGANSGGKDDLLPIGASCSKDEQCASGYCFKGVGLRVYGVAPPLNTCQERHT
jgi:hypothetical protein